MTLRQAIHDLPQRVRVIFLVLLFLAFGWLLLISPKTSYGL
jgi:hypothetical protein